MYSPPPVRSSELRPGRGWYVFAGAFALIMIVLGVAGFAWGLVSAIESTHLGPSFASGEPTPVAFTSSPRRAIYVQVSGSQSATPAADCQISGVTATLTPPTGSFTTTRNQTSWRELYIVDVPQAGTYTVRCSSPDAARFSVGRHVKLSTFVGGLLGGIAALVVLPGIGIVVGLVVSIVVAVKRGNHKRLLIAQQYQGF